MLTLSEIAKIVDGIVVGDGSVVIESISPTNSANQRA
jgi:hypothetical protein